jgi:CUG-BP- and ETR3-like factor
MSSDLEQERARLEEFKRDFIQQLDDSGFESKLFVGNLSESTTTETISSWFESCGMIKEVVLLREPSGRSKKCGFVKFFLKKHAEKAIAAISGNMTEPGSDKPVVVRFADATPHSKAGAQPPAPAPVVNPFRSSGGPQAPYGSPGGHPYGGHSFAPPPPSGPYGAQPYNPHSPYAPPPQHNVQDFGNREFIAQGAGRGPVNANLYVNNTRSLSEHDFRSMFAAYGNLVSTTFYNKGYAFVSYDNPQSAAQAIQALNGLVMNDGSTRLEVSIKKDARDGRV